MSETGDCPICRETLVEPRGLPCLHYFCTSCLQQYINTTNIELTGFKCPCCRNLYIPDNKSLSLNKWAMGFPCANLVSELVKLCRKKYGKMIPPSPVCCDICTQNNDVIAFCNDCRYNLCFGCYHKHLQEDHNIMVNKDYISSPLMCSVHKMIPEFCYKCLTFVCPECATTDHAVCKKEDAVKSCEEAVEKLKKENLIDIEKLKSLQKHSENDLRKLSQNVSEMRKNETNAERSDYCQHLKELNDKMLAIQHYLYRIHHELQCLISHQETENTFRYLQEHVDLFTSNETNEARFNLISPPLTQDDVP